MDKNLRKPKKNSENLGESWPTTLKALSRPNFLSWCILVVAFTIANLLIDNVLVNAVFTLLVGLFSAKAATVFDSYAKQHEDSIIKQKGRTSTRTLYSVLSKLNRVRENLKFYRSSHSDDKVIDLEYKNIWDIVDLLRDDISNAIRDWNDIIPGVEDTLELKSQQAEAIEVLTTLKLQLKEIEESKGEKKAELEDLKKEISQQQEELNKIQEELQKVKYNPLINTPPTTVSGSSPMQLLGRVKTKDQYVAEMLGVKPPDYVDPKTRLG